MSTPKPFQAAAVDAALKAFEKKRKRNFLVADEVGLGKTVVAKEVAKLMAQKSTGQFTIYYIANGQAVSNQNKERVVGFLDDVERSCAVKTPDRLSLIAVAKQSKAKIIIYALTPSTSFPGANARLTGGRKEERAFLQVLLHKAYPKIAKTLPPELLILTAKKESWASLLASSNTTLKSSPPNLLARFREAIEVEFGPEGASRLQTLSTGKPREFIGKLRRALALATLQNQPPDLVILDEFQKYSGLLAARKTDPLVEVLFGKNSTENPPAVLLLSATPYRMHTTQWGDGRAALAHTELLDLIEFLGGSAKKERAQVLFEKFGSKLKEIATHRSVTPAVLQSVADAEQLRDKLRSLLIPMMSRTERDSIELGNTQAKTQPLTATSTKEDFGVYKYLANSFQEKVKHEALPYWSSIPLPSQALGPQYSAWKNRIIHPPAKLQRMTEEVRNSLRPPREWADAKFRALSKIVPSERLAIPWVAPSLPWWPLSSEWQQNNGAPKLLMFSRFRVTPPSVAALLSFGVEAKFLSKKAGYKKAYKQRHFKLSGSPGPVMMAFHPSRWLIENTDPLTAGGKSLKAIREALRRQVLSSLPHDVEHIEIGRLARRRRSIAHTIGSLERKCKLGHISATAWSSCIGDDQAAKSAINKWDKFGPMTSISEAELIDLVEYALSAPGVALGRALWRHDPTILHANRYADLVKLCWQGFRNYIDNPIFLSSLPGENAVAKVMTAVIEGGFESMLDEHFWLRTQSLDSGPAGLANDLLKALNFRAGSFSFYGLDKGKSAKVPIRCHAAVAFGGTESESAEIIDKNGAPQKAATRPEEIRQSFNSPFWPHVLTTTSVGQEGLDFHPWCSRILHWDLTSNPLDLEQREGRVQRYAGLAVRRKLAENLKSKVFLKANRSQSSPWRRIKELAEPHSDRSGMSPWWVLEGAEIVRHIFERPFGRDAEKFAKIKEQRMIYRLALGQPNQEDFLEVLSQGGKDTRELLRPLILDLSAMGLRKR
ncbi:DEAD/DEAH box helicase family protein [Janthinobacterium lividum]|uniref:DEAD/DEAH box helicase family protein n=1 Tax=Janthinobacterium lividum TaxID=29581 RepID=UPI0008FC677B|nr:DEAD/DEAH box helicase family protein [Janthinobacterium lividum]MCC7716915.1 DEAD/DEAH box helicase family protein [Janthinobacterium lividum]WQE31864.1 DEAD/DEAH box helicase family protein [Janthinobacterium lividum]